jgi:nicotinamide-nucleotide amidase
MFNEEEMGKMLKDRGMSLGTVESATGGLISNLVTNIPGSSDYFKGAIVAYDNDVKVNVAGVLAGTIEKYGAVSPQVAEQMALGGRKLLKADLCLSDTGIAGPGGATPQKPVGLFYVGLAHGNIAMSRKYIFNGSREQNKLSAARAALSWLKEYMKDLG